MRIHIMRIHYNDNTYNANTLLYEINLIGIHLNKNST
jgi:hypothetical protein